MPIKLDLDELSLFEIQELKEQLEKKEVEKLGEYKGRKVHEFKLTMVNSTDPKSGKKYSSWKAYYCYEGKRHVVHIGKDPREAESKILKYIYKHPEIKHLAK